MDNSLKSFLQRKFSENSTHIIRSIRETTDEVIFYKPAPDARRPIDFLYEVGYVNYRFAARFRGEAPPPMPEGWITAPAEIASREDLAKYLEASQEVLESVLANLTEEELDEEFSTLIPGWSKLEALYVVSLHPAYHGAQLAYVQTIFGDTEMR